MKGRKKTGQGLVLSERRKEKGQRVSVKPATPPSLVPVEGSEVLRRLDRVKRKGKISRMQENPNERGEYASGGWIKGAIKHPGALKRAASRAGETTHEYAEQHKHDSGKTGARARLALTLSKFKK